ncbi:MAG: hypothetical protein P8169_14345, partial [Chloroflexota bacterium]
MARRFLLHRARGEWGGGPAGTAAQPDLAHLPIRFLKNQQMRLNIFFRIKNGVFTLDFGQLG